MASTTTTPQAPSKKRKRDSKEETDDVRAETIGDAIGEEKKKKQRSRKLQDGSNAPTKTVDDVTGKNEQKKKKKQRTWKPRNDGDAPVPKPNDETAAAATAQDKKSRFIVFIGNLPYSATKAAVEKHFSAVEPTSVRLMTMKDNPSKCKGFAFLEFARYDKMELCLTKFHHSMFNDGKSEARKINVELTAGGGGKSKVRREKLLMKNEKLNEERQRIATDRVKEKAERRAQAEDGENGMHPSRRRRIQ